MNERVLWGLSSLVARATSEVIVPQEEGVCRSEAGKKEGTGELAWTQEFIEETPCDSLLALLKLCLLPPFVKFHLPQRVRAPELLPSQTTEPLPASILGVLWEMASLLPVLAFALCSATFKEWTYSSC